MASSSHLLALLFLAVSLPVVAMAGCFTSIFSFGDSLADTGNAKICGSMPPSIGLPYGQTYFNRFTGRFSDGRLVVDFIAQVMEMPLLRPYLEGGEADDFRYGANFAVAGGTALNTSFFKEKKFKIGWTDYSLGVQLQWFKKLLSSLSPSLEDSRDLLSKSLILMGEIGANDYNYAFSEGRTLDEIQTYVPSVIAEIVSAIKELIELGAKTIVVPGNLPIGCAPCYLTDFQSDEDDYYDPETGCISLLNDFAKYHNDVLVDKLVRLRKKYPDVVISYADYYGAAMTVFRSPKRYGFKSPLVACCGAEGPYNFDWSVWCGNEGTKVCNDPSTAFSWDGSHLTEAAYRTIATNLLSGKFAYPPFLESCVVSLGDHAEL